ncbi:biotin/lipoyl-containing protein, partial [Oleiphilus sp. HI0132]
GNNIHAKPTTQFIVPYLTAVGALKKQAQQYDLNQVYAEVCQANIASLKSKDDKTAMQSVLQRKHLLLTRPVEHLMLEPHLLSGWLAMHQTHFSVDKKGKVSWIENPIKVLDETYHFLNMDFHPGNKRENPAATMIWDHDQEILSDALSFYSTLEEKLDICNFNDLDKALKAAKHSDFDTATWAAIKAAHAGYQAGCRVLLLLPYIAAKTGFFELKVADDLSLVIPENLTNKDYQEAMAKVLVPPPVAKSDEILASSGGMFYSREAPDMPPFIEEGQHFETGDPLYIVEVMKMFNKIAA